MALSARMRRCIALPLVALVFCPISGCIFETQGDRTAIVTELNELQTRIEADETDREAMNRIVAILNSDWSFARTNACVTLGNLGARAKPAVSDLTNALDCGDGYVEREAALAFGKIGPAAVDAVPAIAVKLSQRKFNTAIFCAEALGNIGEPSEEAIASLELASSSDNKELADAAKDALKRLKARLQLQNGSASRDSNNE